VYNIAGGKLNETDLQQLHYFTSYGELALEGKTEGEDRCPPFQRLLFLIRDASDGTIEEGFGLEGGNAYLKWYFEDSVSCGQWELEHFKYLCF
jgi:hypothetical protein